MGNTDWLITCQSVNKSIKVGCVYSVSKFSREINLVPRAFSSTIFKMTIRHFENRRGEGPGDEVGGKSKRSKIPPQSLSFSFSARPRFSRFAAHHSPLVRSRDVRSIALKTLGKERDCSQSTVFLSL